MPKRGILQPDMIKIDLITGFLGAGKTSFLLRYASYLMSQGLKIGILEYDYGAVNVDMLLLHELRGERCELEMLAAACDADCLKRRFRTKLISMAMSGYDRIIIEPSGVFDMDDFFDSLNESPLDRWCEAGSVITLVNAKLPDTLRDEAEFILASQLADAGCVVLSRLGSAGQEDIERTLQHLHRASEKIGVRRDYSGILLAKDWDTLSDEDFRRVSEASYSLHDYVKLIAGDEQSSFSSVYFLETDFELESLEKKLSLLFSSETYGRIHRVKGCVRHGSTWVILNAAADETSIRPISVGKCALIVIGEDLNEDGIKALLS